ncbi:MAG: HAD family phosphatase [Desulfobacterales bacterium]
MTVYIFDMGGVVAYNTDVFPEVFAYLDITGEQFSAFAGQDLQKLFAGNVTPDEFWRSFSARYGKRVDEELFGKFFNPALDQGVIEIIKQLKADSRVVCGTNTFDPHYDYLMSRGNYDIFDAVFASNKIGLSKPHPDFYRYILEKERIKPEGAIFVDDFPENVSAATKLGIASILFTDSQSLAQQLKTCKNQLKRTAQPSGDR